MKFVAALCLLAGLLGATLISASDWNVRDWQGLQRPFCSAWPIIFLIVLSDVRVAHSCVSEYPALETVTDVDEFFVIGDVHGDPQVLVNLLFAASLVQSTNVSNVVWIANDSG